MGILADPYTPGQSAVHTLDARVKLPLAVGFILVTALVPFQAWPAYPLLFTFVLAATILSELGIGFVLKRALIALPFALAAVPVLFTISGQPLVHFMLGPWPLTISLEGLERFIGICLKSWFSVQMAILLAASTPLPDLLLAMRVLKVPRLLVAVIGLMWRYLFLMVAEAGRLMRAKDARSGTQVGGRKAGGSLGFRARTTGGMAGSLFLRSLERSDRVYAAMLARGYDGEIRSLPVPALARSARIVFFTGGLILLVILGLSFLF